MRRYFAFLRGINISGRNKLAMSDLKAGFGSLGFTDVSTYLNSGNVAFCAEDSGNLKRIIEEMIRSRFDMDIAVYVICEESLKSVLENAPSWWDTGDKALYDNLIFILSEDTPEDICSLIGPPSEGLEQIEVFENVIFWTFDRAKYQKCSWWKKTASSGIADKLTIRTANTVRKLTSQL